jgi:MFS family permease
MIEESFGRWWTVLAGTLGCAVGSGIVVLYAFPLFATGFQQEFHWDRVIYSYCLTGYLLATGFGTVTLGIALRRYGVRAAASAYVFLFALTIASIAFLPPSAPLFYGAFALIGFGGAAATAMPYAVAVAGWFDERRGLALGLVNAGAGFGSSCAPLLARFLMGHYGWRGGFIGMGLLAGLVALFGLRVLVREPEGDRTASAAATVTRTRGFVYLRSSTFWLIAVPIVGVSIATFGVMGTMVAFLGDHSVSAGDIALTLSTAGLASWVARIATGYLLDRVFAPHLAALTFLLAVAGIVCLAFAPHQAFRLTGAALIGLTLGSEGDLVAFLLSRYYDFANYSRVLGAMWVCWAWGGGIGTFIAGTSFRLTHSYLTGFGIFIAVLLVSSAVILRLGPYGHPQHAAMPVTSPA